MSEEEITAAIQKLALLQGASKKRTSEEEYERIRQKVAEQICKRFR